MTEFTRRAVVVGGAIVTAGAAIGNSTRADSSCGTEFDGTTLRLGGCQLTQLNDGAWTLPLEGCVTNASGTEISKALEAAYMPTDVITSVCNPIVINTGRKTVLIDAGFGPGFSSSVGMLSSNLVGAGIHPNDIDIVLVSHFHRDHIGGLVNPDGRARFPRAEIKVPAAEWEFYMSNAAKNRNHGSHERSVSFAQHLMNAIGERVVTFKWNAEVAPRIVALCSAGHTPGHTSFIVDCGTITVLVDSDLVSHPALFLAHPDWHSAEDLDGSRAALSRRRFYDMAVAERLSIVGYHFPFPVLGRAERVGTQYRLEPVAWSPPRATAARLDPVLKL
jgi:glyoxylase-like metal-dependent hydrolase (beta-lactamase superfamily II)